MDDETKNDDILETAANKPTDEGEDRKSVV